MIKKSIILILLSLGFIVSACSEDSSSSPAERMCSNLMELTKKINDGGVYRMTWGGTSIDYTTYDICLDDQNDYISQMTANGNYDTCIPKWEDVQDCYGDINVSKISSWDDVLSECESLSLVFNRCVNLVESR